MAKSIQNANTIACKLRLASTKTTNHRLKVTKEEQHNRKEIVEKQKIEAMAAKCHKDRKGISLYSRKKENYDGDTRNDMDLDQVNDK